MGSLIPWQKKSRSTQKIPLCVLPNHFPHCYFTFSWIFPMQCTVCIKAVSMLLSTACVWEQFQPQPHTVYHWTWKSIAQSLYKRLDHPSHQSCLPFPSSPISVVQPPLCESSSCTPFSSPVLFCFVCFLCSLHPASFQKGPSGCSEQNVLSEVAMKVPVPLL